MARFGLAPSFTKPAAQATNIAVLARARAAGHFDARLCLPFAPGSVPPAYTGGVYTATDAAYS